MRKVIWERKTKPVPFSNPSAERFRNSMRPSLLTRIADKLFDRVETVVDRVDAIDRRYSYGNAVTVVFFAVMAAGFIFIGRIDRAPYYFGMLGLLAFASRAYFDWHKRHPLPPVQQRRWRDEAWPALHGLVGGAILVSAHFIAQYSLGWDGYFDWFTIAVNGIAATIGVYVFRTRETAEKESGQLIGFLGVALMLLASWLTFKVLL